MSWFEKIDPNFKNAVTNDILDLKKKISNSDLEIEKLKSHIISLRGLINRKFAMQQEEKEIVEEETKKEEQKDIKGMHYY